jgi:hypothetical protein
VTQPLGAATETKSVTINATVSAAASLTVSTATPTFPNSNPETARGIGPDEGVVSVTAKARTSAGSPVTLALNAAADLKSGSDTIPISNINWTASGAGVVPRTMAVLTEVTVASWIGSGDRSGAQTFAMANSWDYARGSHTATATYTLTAP